MLSVAVTFFRTDEPLKDAAQDVGGDLSKINSSYSAQNAFPCLDGSRSFKDESACPVVLVGIEERLVIAGTFDSSVEKILQILVSVGRCSRTRLEL